MGILKKIENSDQEKKNSVHLVKIDEAATMPRSFSTSPVQEKGIYAPTLEEERANSASRQAAGIRQRIDGRTTRRPAEREKLRDMDLHVSAMETPFVSRLKNIVTGAAKSTGASYVNNAGTAIRGEAERQKQQSAGEIAAWQDTIKAYQDVLADPTSTQSDRDTATAVIADLQRRIGAYGKAYGTDGANERAANTVWEDADRLADSANADIERAQEGLGAAGKLLTGAGVAGTQMAIDMLTAPPGATLVPLFFRASGGAAQQARRNGADFDTANTVGGITGAVEVLTEKMFDGLAGIYGGGAADDLVAQFISKHTSSPAFGRLLSYAASAAGESVEEVVSGLVDPAIQSIYNKKSYGENFDPQELLESAIIGGLLGLVGGNTMYNNVLEADAAAIEAENEAAGVGEGATERALEMLTGRTTVRSTPTAAQDAQESAQRVSRETMAPAQEMPHSGAQAQTFARYYEQDVRDMTGELGGKAFVERYDGTQDIAEYTAGFVRYWNAGATGRKIGSVQNTGGLNELQRYAAYYAGQNDAARSTVSEQSGVRDVAINAQRGLSSDDTTARNTAAWSEDLRGTVDALGHKLGVRVVVDDTFEGVSANGYYDAKTNEIHLAKDAENPVLQVVRHEATHRMQQLSPKEYRAFRDYAVRMAGEDAVEEKRQAYSRGSVELSEEEAMDEIAAETAEKLLTDETAISDFIRDNRTAAQKFYDALRSVVQKVREALGADQTLAQAERLWKNAFEKADAQAQENAANKNAAQTDGVKYSLIGKTADGIEVYETSEEVKRLPYKERMEKFLDIMRNEYKGRTAKFVADGDVYYARFDGDDLRKNVYGDKKSSEHGWKAKINTGADGSIFELVENARYSGGKAEAGKTAKAHQNLAGWEYFVKTVQIDGKVYDLLANVRKKPDGEYVYSIQLNENKKKTPAPPRQYQDGTAKAENRPVGVPTDVSDGSITDADENSKRKFSLKTDSEGRELSAQQQEYFKDSKVRNKNGYLRPVYHYTNEKFTQFERRDASAQSGQTMGDGYYFSTNPLAFADFGKYEMDLYANVKNPFRMKMTKAEANNVYDKYFAPLHNDRFGTYRPHVINSLMSPFKVIDYLKEAAKTNGTTTSAILSELGYDGINNGSIEWVAFDSNQLKNVTNTAPTDNADIRFSLKTVTPEEAKANADAVLKFFGRTYSWNETGYITADGSRVDLSGRHDGAPGGYRTVDHRDVRDALGSDYGGEDYSGAMVQFMHEGNIRISPESGGINIQVEPTKAQYDKLEQFVQHNKGEVTLDLDDENGNTVGSVEYAPRTRASKVISDIKAYFADGTIPEQTEESSFRYSLKNNSPEAVAAKQQEMIEYLRGQLRRSRGVTTKKGDVAKIARATAKAWDSSADVTERLQAMYDFMANGKDASGNELTWDDLWSEAKSIAGDMLGESMTRNDDLYREYADLRRTVRDTKLNVPKEMDGDLDALGGYGAFRRGEGRALNLSRSEGTGIDDFFQTLSDSYPEYFDEAMTSNPADQLARIAEVMNDLKPVYENRFAGDEQAVNYLADELINSFYDARQEAPTFADKAALDKQEAVAKVKNAARDKLNAREAKLRSDYNERIAKMREMNRQKIEERMSKLREQRDKKLEAVKDKYKAKEAKGRERRNASELRGKIIRHSKDLSAKLLKPNDKQHIPERLRVTVAAVLDAINEESAYGIDETSGKRVTDGSGTPTNRTEAFRALRAAFAEIRGNGEADGMTIDPDLEDNLTEIETMRDIPLGSMNVGQLTTIWNTLKAVETAVRNENKAFGAQRFKTISDFAEHIKLDNLVTRERGNSPNRVVNAVDNLLNVDQLTPEAYFRRLGSTGTDVFNMLRRSQDKHITIMQQAQEYTKNAVGKTDVYELEKEMHTFTVNGEDVTLSTAQLMSLYELMKRPQALEHLELGGIRATDTGRSGVRRGGRSTPVKPDLNMLLDMTNELTAEQKTLADKLQSYMANELSDLGNEASMEVYGYEKFTEENYFPIKVDKNQTKTDVAKEAQSATIAGRGFTKGTKPHANNAVMIDSIFSVFAEHTSDMATYSAWLGAMENLSRIWNFAFYDADNARVGDVKSIIERSFGKGGNGYMRQLIDNLNNGVRAKDGNSIMDMLTGSYKASAIGANLRVWLQQPTAILRALNEISPADFLAGAKRDKPGTWNKVREYAPIAVWKDWGYFDADTGRQMKDVLFGDSSRLNKLNNALIAPAGTMDSIAWSHLWNALEVETLRTHPELTDGSEAFYKAVAERFNGVIDRTQVVDGILQRSQIMRSSNGAVKMATSFMSEPTKVYNMFASDLHEARTAQNPQARKAAKAKLARTSAALLASFAANAAAQALVDGLRDDDRERDYWEKFLTAYTENGLDALNPASYIPIARDILSVFQGYGVERMDMSAVDALMKAAINAGKAIEGGGRKSVQNAILELVNSGARVFGIPAANVKRDLFAVLNTAANETDNYGMQYALYKFLYNPEYPQNKTEVKKILWNAYQNDRAAYDAIYADVVKNDYFATETQTTEENLAAWLKKQEKAATFEGNSSAYYKAAENLRTQYGNLYTLANDKGRKDADDFLVSYYSGDASAASKTNDKLGVSAEDYASYLLALSVYDKENKSGNLGTYTNAERESAINATGLSKKAKAFLWTASGGGKNNPFA